MGCEPSNNNNFSNIENPVIRNFIEVNDIGVDKSGIDKLNYISSLATQYGLKIDTTGLTKKNINFWLSKDDNEIKDFFEWTVRVKESTQRISELTKKWSPILEKAQTREKYDSLYTIYQDQRKAIKDSVGDYNGFSE